MKNIAIYLHAAQAGDAGLYCYCLIRDNRTSLEEKQLPGTSVNRAILQAAVDVLQKLPPKNNITFFSTSDYLVKGITEWIKNWKQKGWLDRSTNKLKNSDLWKRLDELTQQLHVTWLRPQTDYDQQQLRRAVDQTRRPSQQPIRQQRIESFDERPFSPYWQQYLPYGIKRCDACDCPIDQDGREKRYERFCSPECRSGLRR